MPIYEYRCEECRKVTSLFVRSANAAIEARCEHCGSASMSRMVSRVNRVQTQADIADRYSRPEDAYRDPRQIGQWVEQRFAEYGMDIPDDTRQMIDAAREGELPAPVDDV